MVKDDPGGRPLQQKATSLGQDLRRQWGRSGTGERCGPAIGLPSSPPADFNRWLLALPLWSRSWSPSGLRVATCKYLYHSPHPFVPPGYSLNVPTMHSATSLTSMTRSDANTDHIIRTPLVVEVASLSGFAHPTKRFRRETPSSNLPRHRACTSILPVPSTSWHQSHGGFRSLAH